MPCTKHVSSPPDLIAGTNQIGDGSFAVVTFLVLLKVASAAALCERVVLAVVIQGCASTIEKTRATRRWLRMPEESGGKTAFSFVGHKFDVRENE